MDDELWTAYWKSRSVEDRNRIVERWFGLAVSCAEATIGTGRRRSLLQDAVQDGSFGLIRAIEKYKPELGEFSPFAWRHIRWAIIDAQRSRDHIPKHARLAAKKDGKPLPEFVGLPEGLSVDAESPSDPTSFWQGHLRGLDQKQRLMVLMHFRMGVTLAECGKSLGFSESMVSRHVSSAVRHMRSREGAHV